MPARPPKRRTRRTRAIAIAALGLVAVAVAVAILASGPGTYGVIAKFGQVQGLVPGAEVEVAGLRVGEVSSVGLGADGLPRVGMTVDDSYRLRSGARANVRIPSASGEENAFVELTAGDGRPLPDGAVLGRGSTDQPVEIDQALSTFNPRTRAAVRATLAGLDGSLEGHGAALAAVLHDAARSLGNTSEAAGEVAADGAALRNLVSGGRQITAALAGSRDELSAVADRLAAVLSTTAAHQSGLAKAAARLPAGLRSPRLALDRLDRSVGRLRGVVADAAPGVDALVPFARALRPALASARPTLDEAASLVGEAPSELAKTRSLLSDAGPTLREMAPTLRSAGPILNEARVRTPDFFSFFSNWADFTSVYDANGHAARVALVLPPAPNNVVGPSDDRAGSLAAPFLRTPGVLEGEPWTDYRRSFLGGGR